MNNRRKARLTKAKVDYQKKQKAKTEGIKILIPADSWHILETKELVKHMLERMEHYVAQFQCPNWNTTFIPYHDDIPCLACGAQEIR